MVLMPSRAAPSHPSSGRGTRGWSATRTANRDRGVSGSAPVRSGARHRWAQRIVLGPDAIDRDGDVVKEAGGRRRLAFHDPNTTSFCRTILRLKSPTSTLASIPAPETPVRQVIRDVEELLPYVR